MGLFVVYCLDKPGAVQVRLANRSAHLDWAAGFKDRIATAGPMFDADGETFIGSLFVIASDSLDDVRDWATEDPYAKAGLFERVDIHPFRWVLGEGRPASS
ncbi:MAG: YciI family protein [Pseudomonadota bacterium]